MLVAERCRTKNDRAGISVDAEGTAPPSSTRRARGADRCHRDVAFTETARCDVALLALHLRHLGSPARAGRGSEFTEPSSATTVGAQVRVDAGLAIRRE
jgi:hypothetical protein